MEEKKYAKELRVALELARKASKAILQFYYGSMDKKTKADGTPVTNADILSNKIIVDGLHTAFPNDGIVSEELETISGERTWYVDPIDGTKGFIGHSDQFAIHIGLADREPILGLIYKPTTGEYFFAIKGQGAFRVNPDGSRKKLSVDNSNKGLVVVANSSFLREEPVLTQKLNPRKVYVSGGLGLRAMSVAEGISNVYIKSRKYSGGTWDICAPHAIINEAGGYVSYTNGSKIEYFGQRKLDGRLVMANNSKIGCAASKMIEKYGVN